jgi:hypothetical protein
MFLIKLLPAEAQEKPRLKQTKTPMQDALITRERAIAFPAAILGNRDEAAGKQRGLMKPAAELGGRHVFVVSQEALPVGDATQ